VIKKYDSNNRYAITFDSPGYDYLLPRKTKTFEEHFVNYVANPNLVNTCQSHFGKIIQIFKPHSSTDEIINITINEMWNTYTNHKRRKFVETLSRGIKLYPVINNWPKSEHSDGMMKLFNKFEVATDDDTNKVVNKLFQLFKNIKYKRTNKVEYDFS
jgi:hypothetical protein